MKKKISIAGRQQQHKIQTLFHKNSSPLDLFPMNLDVYLATSSHKNKNLKHLSLSLRHDYATKT